MGKYFLYYSINNDGEAWIGEEWFDYVFNIFCYVRNKIVSEFWDKVAP